MASYPFNVGDRVELHPADDPASRSTATIAAIESDHLALTRPKTTSGALTPMEAGERWLLRCFNRRRGISEFITTVLRVFPGPLGEVHVAPPTHMDKVQRRRFVRLPTSWPVRVEGHNRKWEGRALDLSGGGARVRLPAPLEAGSVWKLTFKLPLPGRELVVRARCLRTAPHGSGWTSSFAFLDLNETDRDRLIGLILALDARLQR